MARPACCDQVPCRCGMRECAGREEEVPYTGYARFAFDEMPRDPTVTVHYDASQPWRDVRCGTCGRAAPLVWAMSDEVLRCAECHAAEKTPR